MAAERHPRSPRFRNGDLELEASDDASDLPVVVFGNLPVGELAFGGRGCAVISAHGAFSNPLRQLASHANRARGCVKRARGCSDVVGVLEALCGKRCELR